MRPITKPNNPTTYAELAQNFQVNMMKYPSETIQQFYAFFASQNWYQLAGLAQPSQQQQQDLKKKKFYLKKLGEHYGRSRLDLFNSIGEVCTYCGMPIRDAAHVEHIVPKAWFPDQVLLWANFLLACRDCNSRKSSRPSGQQGDTVADYVWPQTDLQGRMIAHVLCAYENKFVFQNSQAAPIPYSFISVKDLCLWMWKGNITIAIAKKGTWEAVLTITTVNPQTNTRTVKTYNLAVLLSYADPKAKAFGDDIFTLNSYTDSPEVSDRRMTERTQAWVQAVDAVRNVRTVRTAPTAVRQAVIQQALDTIRATGFWLVWVEVFVVQGGTVLEPEERDLFVDFLKGAAFPGTAGARLFFD
jgi:5-methylcytosine-specific restriction endonuclease McrA